MIKDIKAVIDTNVVINAIIGSSPTSLSVYNAFVDSLFTPVLSPTLQAEILNVVSKPHIRKYFRSREIKRFKELIKTDSILVVPTIKTSLCRDTKDNFILETALAANADRIVTNDKDLLVLKYFHNIPIITPGEFLRLLT